MENNQQQQTPNPNNIHEEDIHYVTCEKHPIHSDVEDDISIDNSCQRLIQDLKAEPYPIPFDIENLKKCLILKPLKKSDKATSLLYNKKREKDKHDKAKQKRFKLINFNYKEIEEGVFSLNFCTDITPVRYVFFADHCVSIDPNFMNREKDKYNCISIYEHMDEIKKIHSVKYNSINQE